MRSPALAVLAVLLVLGGLVAACRHTDDVRPLAVLPCPAELALDLRWVRHGSRLLVDGQWLLDPERGTFTPLPYATSRPAEGGGRELMGLSLSRDGERVVVWDAREFRFGPVDSALTGPWPLPVPAVPEASGDARLARLLFWDTGGALLLVQQWLAAEARPECAVFDARAHVWRPAVACPKGDFVELVQVDPGPAPWMTVASEAEGMRSFQLILFPSGVAEPPPLSLASVSQLLLRADFSRDGKRLALTTPCRLEREGAACQDVDENAPWRRYSWRLAEGRLVLEQEGLPPYSVPSPTGGGLAWPVPGRVCLGDGVHPEAARCHALPASACGG